LASVRKLISNMTAGVFSPRLYGRPDIPKYGNALAELTNMTVVPHGGVRKRSGFKFVVEVKDSDPVRLVPFQYNVEQPYMLVFGPSYVWFCKDQGIITHTPVTITAATNADPCVVTAAGHGFSGGDRVVITGVTGMHQLNNRHFVVQNTTMDTFELADVDSSAYGTYSGGGQAGEIVELSTGYTADELDDLQFAQSADTLYIAHGDHPLAKITRTSHTSWQLLQVDIVKGPFRNINPDPNLTLTPSSFSASATGYGTQQVGDTFTLTASSPLFDEDMVGGLWRLYESSNGETGVASPPVGSDQHTIANNDVYTTDGKVYGVTNLATATTWEPFTAVPKHDSGRVRIYGGSGTGTFFDSDYLHSGWCIIRITGYTSTTVVTGEIIHNQMPASIIANGTAWWEEGAFSIYRGFPRCVTFFEQRLVLAATASDPQTVWGSRTGAFENFEDGPDDNDALTFTIASGLVDYIRWIIGGRLLSCGTASAEFAIAGTTNNDALTPTNVRAIPQTTFGSSGALPVRVGQIILYPQRQGDPDNASRKLREFAYQYENDQFASADLTVFSEHITGEGYEQIAYQVDPDSIVWARRSDGELAAVTYERDQQVVGWHSHSIAGTAAEVENAAVIPGADGDELWVQTTRTINSATVRYIEVLQPAFRPETDKEDAFVVDCGLTYEGDSTTTIGSLWHLEGETVDVLNNGAVERDKTVSNGAITLSVAGTKAHVGKRISAVMETLDLEAGAQGGTAQSRKAKLGDIFIRLYRSLGGTIGPDTTFQDDIEYRTPAAPMDDSPPLFSGLKRVEMPGGWRDDHGEDGTFGRIIRIEHDDPLPFFVTGIVAEIDTTG
jgi:hypothetical protein